MGIVEEINCSTAEEFLSKITIDRPHNNLGYSLILFRGVANSNYELIPTALRMENAHQIFRLAGFSGDPSSSEKDAKNEYQLGHAEAKIIGSFFRFADVTGLSVPEVGIETRQLLQLPIHEATPFFRENLTGRTWPPDNLLPLIGLAQHYGLPTRLLDWTRDPLTAAYFAANGAIRRALRGDAVNDENNKLAVWIFNLELLEDKKISVPTGKTQAPNIPLTFVTAPASTNPNLRAQRGVFTVWRPKMVDKERQLADRRPLDVLIDERVQLNQINVGRVKIFYKITLPLSKADNLRYFLIKNGMNAARLFPSFDGAAEAVREWSTRQLIQFPITKYNLGCSGLDNDFDKDILSACFKYLSYENPGWENNTASDALQDIRNRLTLLINKLKIDEAT